MAKGIRNGRRGIEPGVDPLLERIPSVPLGSHLDLGEGFQQISVNLEGDLSISEQGALGLGQLLQLCPGSPAPGMQKTSSILAIDPAAHSAPSLGLVSPLLLWAAPKTGPELPFLPPCPASGPACEPPSLESVFPALP